MINIKEYNYKGYANRKILIDKYKSITDNNTDFKKFKDILPEDKHSYLLIHFPDGKFKVVEWKHDMYVNCAERSPNAKWCYLDDLNIK